MQTPSIFRCLMLVGATSAALGLSAIAQAGALQLNAYTDPPALPFSIVLGTPTPITTSPGAGAFSGFYGPVSPPTDPIIVWCFELNQPFNFGTLYTDYTQVIDAHAYSGVTAALSELFFAAGGISGATLNNVTSAAFQLAVWEIKYDAGGPYNLAAGNFKVTGGDAGAISQANTWLGALDPTKSDAYTIFEYQSPEHQDFVAGFATPKLVVPEPSPLPLLGAGLAVMMLAMRRRSGKQI